MKKKYKENKKFFFSKEKGAIAVISAFVILICIGFAAFAIDASLWYVQKRQLQKAATAGAIGGAYSLGSTGTYTYTNYATHDIRLNGCLSSPDGNCTIVAINNPPASGPQVGNNRAVEVVLSMPAQLFFSGLFLGTSPTIGARAVAGRQPVNQCVQSLATSGVGITLTGNANISGPNCGISANSTAQNSISLTGNAQINVSTVQTVGGTSSTGNSTINAPGGITTFGATTSDPYSGLTIPSYSGCNQTNYSLHGNNSASITPGVYCGGISLSANSSLTMASGVYIIDRGSFSVTGNASITQTGTGGITIILTSSTGSNYGTININSNGNINMSAPTSGTTAGILFYGDRASSGLSPSFTGNANQSMTGVYYFPTGNITFTGNAVGSSGGCFQLIGNRITLNGNGNFGTGCNPLPTGGPVVLFE